MREVFSITTSLESSIPIEILQNYQELEKCFGILVELKHDNPNYSAFAPLKLNISDNSLAQALEILSTELAEKQIKEFRITEDILDIFREEDEFFTPGELIKLMIQLAEIDNGDEIYCPYDSLGKFALLIIEQGGHPYLEILGNMPIISVLNILNDVDIQVSYRHPIYTPTYDEREQPKQHKLTICISPTGIKYNQTLISQQSSLPFKSWIDRDVYTLECLLARSNNRAVIALNSTLLFSDKAETFRESLLERNIVETVISLPSGIIPYVIPQFSIVVFNKDKKNHDIRFVDGANDLFWVRENHQAKLVEWESLVKVSRSDADESIVIDVSKEKVQENKSSLEVAQYIYSSEEKKVEQLLLTQTTKLLVEVVSIIPPISNTHIRNNSSAKIKAKEITIDDFPDYGYLSPPTKEVDTINYKKNEHFLRPYDIVIVTKGSVGKVGITPPDVPAMDEIGWVVNQSYFILRAKLGISAISLYMYLISEVGQTAISRVVSKATRPLIRLGELKQLPIIIPTTEESLEIEKTFNRMVKINSLTSKLAKKQIELHKKHWSLSKDEK